MAERILEVRVVGDVKDLERAYGRAQKQTQSLGSKFAGLAKMAALGAGAAGVGLLAVGLKKSVDAAKEAEAAQARLTNALDSQGISYSKHGRAIDAAIQKTSRLAALDDEDLSDAFSKLVRTTGDVTKATEGMNLAADIARARHISLEAATKTVEKAMNGNAGALKKVGVEVDKNTSSTEALERAQKQFAGSAAAYGQTAAGAQDKLNVAFENLQETVGAKLLPVLQRLALKLVELIEWSEKNWPKFRQAAVDTFNAIRPAIDFVIDRIQGVETVVQGVVKTIRGIKDGDWSLVWNGLKDVVGGVIGNIVATMVTLPAKIMAAVSRKAFSGLSAIGGWIKDAVLAGLEGIGRGVLGYITDAINGAIGLLNSAINAYNAIPLAPNIPNVPKVGAGSSSSNPAAGYRGHRAAGGPVAAGYSYLVGERGPELFVPGASGTIIPNGGGAGGGWGGGDIVIQIDGREIARASRKHGLREARGLVASTVTGHGAYGLA